jgi:hypothetical protein
MPLTQNVEIGRFVDQELRYYGVLAGAHIFKGAFVGLDRETGYVRPLVAGDPFAGIAYEEIDNSEGDDGDKMIRLFTQGDFQVSLSGAQPSVIGRPVFAVSDDSLSLTNVTGLAYAGMCIAVVDTNVAILRLATFADAQIARQTHTPLASSTAGATTNPILIAHKPLLILSAEVIFNTAPDQGLLDVGADNSDPDEIVDAFNLAGLTNNVKVILTLADNVVGRDERLWAKVGQADSAAGVGGLLTLNYIELP